MSPSLEDIYPVSAEQSQAFGRDGHILLRDVAPPGVIDLYHPAVKATSERYSYERRALAERDTYGKAFLQITNLWEVDKTVKQFVFARRFAQIAADLMGVERVRLYHDQALFKEPGGGRTPWHRDKFYWNLDTDNMITMWMPLVDITPEMGTMSFATGSHKNGAAEDLHISDESEEFYKDHIAQKNYSVHQTPAMRAGDATFHNGWAIHSADANDSDITREVMTIIYFADGARVTDPVNNFQRADHERWLDNIEPGKLAGGILNPILN